MDKYEEISRIQVRDARRNLNYTIAELKKFNLLENDAKKVLAQNMSSQQLIDEFNIAKISASYVCSKYITLEKLINALQSNKEQAKVIIEIFNLVDLFQKYGLTEDKIKKGNNSYSFYSLYVTGFLNFSDNLNDINMLLMFNDSSSKLQIDYDSGKLGLTYKYNDNYIVGFDSTIELDANILLPLTDKDIKAVYRETRSDACNPKKTITREIIIDGVTLSKLLREPRKLDEFIYAYDSGKLDEYFEVEDPKRKILNS